MKKKTGTDNGSCRLNKVGGQAVIEGVMMKAGNKTVTTCRKDDGSMVVYDDEFVSVRKKKPLLNLPIIRGVVNFIEMLSLSMKTLNASADALGIEEEDDKFTEWCKKHLGARATDVIMVISLILGLGLSLLLFMFLPTWVADGIDWLWQNLFHMDPIHPTVIAVIEGVVKVAIFITYLLLVSMMKDIKRVFMYHGAEHKTIACFEAGEELTPENAAKHRRFHPRCGTSFMFLMIGIGILVGMLVRNILPANTPSILISLVKLTLLPLTMGVGYEILMIAGKHDNVITRIISAPGLWVQRITTKEPTLDMLEVAIVSTKCALRDEFPEFMEFYQSKGWEPKKDETEEVAEAEVVEAEVAETEVEVVNSEVETEATETDTEVTEAIESIEVAQPTEESAEA
ncbi:MAG: DUF1385 domain-containing protein [Clostridia bacterium]|nr:DUF1385 domain-containing protein [Clostridia bacterium]